MPISIDILAILGTVLIFFVGSVLKWYADRRQTTFQYLNTVITDAGPIHNANLNFARWIRDKKVFADDKLDSEDDDTVIELIDYYDLISDAANRGVINKEMVIVHLGGRMRAAYDVVEKYIEARRKTLDRPGLYTPFVRFVRHEIGKRDV